MIHLLLVSVSTWMLGPFDRTNITNPILGPNPRSAFRDPMRKKVVSWEHDHVFNPAAIDYKGQIYLLYRAEDNSGSGIGGHTSRIGLADSVDGIHFSKQKLPVLFPTNDKAKKFEWTGGCEDPRVVRRPDSTFVMTYTAWDRKTARLSVATSKDLVHWKKYGPAFLGSKFENTWSKSGSIVTQVVKGQLVAAKVNGKYWMYWGEGTLKVATSTNLINWKPLADTNGKLLGVLTTRQNSFDSDLVEPGPPAVLTKKGIVLIYNGKNAQKGGDPTLGPGAYAAGQALFDRQHPEKLIDRGQTCFLKPELAVEKSGQYAAGTVFTEGLAFQKGRWFLYYGAADSFIGVTVTKK